MFSLPSSAQRVRGASFDVDLRQPPPHGVASPPSPHQVADVLTALT